MELSTNSKKLTCPECGSDKLFVDKEKGEIVCRNCGFIIEESMIDLGQEWREFDSSQGSLKRTGSPITLIKHDKGLSTSVGKTSDIYNLESGKRRKFTRLQKWQGRISTAIERNLKFALQELRRISSILDLTKTVEENAASIYRKAAIRGLVRGRSMESVVAGALYAACKKFNIPRTLDEIAEAFPLDRKEVGKTYRFICRQLRIKILPTDPYDYVSRFSSELKLSPKTQEKAMEIIRKAKAKEITSGKGPTGIAAAALYVAALLSGEKRTQREVADVAGVTEVTIRNRYKELLEKLDIERKEEIEKIVSREESKSTS